MEVDSREHVRKVLFDSCREENLSKYGDYHSKSLPERYKIAQSMIPNIEYTLQDVDSLTKGKWFDDDEEIAPVSFRDIYVSALINKIIKEDDVFEISINRWYDGYLGTYLPRGKIVLRGDCCGHVGFEMTGGIIELVGNCSAHIGMYMKGGKIVIHDDIVGYCEDEGYIGYGMEDGEIEMLGNALAVHRNATYEDYCYAGIGWKMTGGKITIHKDARNVGCQMKGGSITVKGSAGIDNVNAEIGRSMEGGDITILGSVQGTIGEDMKQGSIEILNGCQGTVGIYMNGGRITIKNGLEGQIGKRMKSGSIRIEGNVKNCDYDGIGNKMRDGEIKINGNVFDNAWVGYEMSGGNIAISGDLGPQSKVGQKMRGGIVNIDGFMPSDRSFPFLDGPLRLKGSVYHKGKLVKDPLSTRFVKWSIKKFGDPDLKKHLK